MSDWDVLIGYLQSEGLAVPSPPAQFVETLTSVDDNLVSTRPDFPWPARPELFVDEFVDGQPDDYCIIGRSGRGVGGQVLVYYAVVGQVGVFVQASWGGVDDDEATKERFRRSIARSFDLADAILADVGPSQSSRRRCVVASDLGRSRYAEWEAGHEPDWTHGRESLERAAADWEIVPANSGQ